MSDPFFQSTYDSDGPRLTRMEAENERLEKQLKALGGSVPENYRRPEFSPGDQMALEFGRKIKLLELISQLLTKTKNPKTS